MPPLKRSEIRPTVAAFLTALPLLAGEQVAVVLDDGGASALKIIGQQLDDRGAVVALPPILSTGPRAASGGGATAIRANLTVHVRVNPAENEREATEEISAGANLDPDDVVEAIEAALVAAGADHTHPLFGCELGDGERNDELVNDPGHVTNAIFFTVPYFLPV